VLRGTRHVRVTAEALLQVFELQPSSLSEQMEKLLAVGPVEQWKIGQL
jgi:hypothetical protein